MKLRNRLLLVTFGVVVFIVATPLLVLFTGGYKIDWKNHTLVKTGAFVAKTLPSKADIYIDDSKIKGTTPEVVRFLMPGDYTFRIEKAGYQSWTKRLHIQAGLGTWANFDRDFVALFTVQPQPLDTQSVNFSSLSQKGDEIAYVQNGNLYVRNVDNLGTQNLGDISSLSFPLTFSNDLKWSNASAITDYFRNHTLNVPFPVESIGQVLTDGNNFAIVSSNNLYILNSSADLTLLAKSVSGAALDGENLWYVQGSSLDEFNTRTGQTQVVSSALPSSTKSQIIRGEGNTFLLLDNSLYVLNDSLEKIYDGVDSANYDISAHELLFSDPNEIFVYNPSKKATDLLLRSISKISSPVLNSYTGYVFFVNEDKIKAIELDGRDHRNIYTVVKPVPQDSNLALNGNGDMLTIFDDSQVATFKIR